MIHHNRLSSVTAGFVITAAVLMGAQPSRANAFFDFEFESFAVAGSVTFDDDFEDGLRDSLTTSQLVDQADGTVTREEEGALVLSSVDGSSVTVIGNTVVRADTVALESMPITNAGSGTTSVTAAILRNFTRPGEPMASRSAGVQLGSTADSDTTTLELQLTDTALSIVWVESVGGTSAIVGSDTFVRNDASGDIVLQLSLDQSLDTAVARYSLDGGSSFVEQGSWDSPPVSGGFDFDQDLFAQLSASAVPEPAASLLGATSVAALALLRRVRKLSAQSSNAT